VGKRVSLISTDVSVALKELNGWTFEVIEE